jgi:hypothetical protein
MEKRQAKSVVLNIFSSRIYFSFWDHCPGAAAKDDDVGNPQAPSAPQYWAATERTPSNLEEGARSKTEVSNFPN